ncbi:MULTISPECIES: hypothetical protein [unclassified Synechocystis]|uniref:hypothetical protein n=1 Tax=unclassified Synechocystis TaxID=2640012 RepID=UPI001EE67056|nr:MULTISPECIES: hypothetical protein [unclassified Synechocystis]
MVASINYTDLSFEQAIAHSQDLLGQIAEDNLSDQEITTAIANLVATENGARGFFVTFLTTQNFPLADQPSPALLTALASAPAIVGELLVKNLAMASATEILHQRLEDGEAAQGSRQVAQRTQTLINKLQLPGVPEKLTELEQSLEEAGPYTAFLQRWNYDQEQREAIRQAIAALEPSR